MQIHCPSCVAQTGIAFPRSIVVHNGSYYRSSDKTRVQKFYCKTCGLYFTEATWDACHQQKKRHLNSVIHELLSSLVSMRRVARILRINRITVARKLVFNGIKCAERFHEDNEKAPKAKEIEFDDLETFEHTKCKPLSVTLAVETGTRRILGIEVSTMRAKGRLTEKAKKYGPRVDGRKRARGRLFGCIQDLVEENVVIKSDENPHYKPDVKKFFPKAKYVQFKGQRGSSTGQGELKREGYDPLFSLNHTCAMLRANVNRLIRKTWCTTKNPDRLYFHLIQYAHYHNSQLI